MPVSPQPGPANIKQHVPVFPQPDPPSVENLKEFREASNRRKIKDTLRQEDLATRKRRLHNRMETPEDGNSPEHSGSILNYLQFPVVKQ